MELKIYCSWCSEHPFKVDKETAALAGIILLTCPRCGRDTRLSFRPGGEMSVLPGNSKSSLPGGQEAIAHDESKPLTHLRQGGTVRQYGQERAVPIASAMPTGVANAQRGGASSISQADHPPSTIQGDDKLFSSRMPSAGAPKRGKTWRADPAELPWYDKPNAFEILEERRADERLSDEEYTMLHQWATEGYCIVSGMIPDRQIDSMMRDFEDLWTADRPFDGLQFYDLRLGPNGSLVTLSHAELLAVDLEKRLEARGISNWRINHFDAYSDAAREIFFNQELIRLTSLIFNRRSVPDSTLNFMYGSAQDAHQDTAVFHIFPPNYIIGAWIACEDISPDSGPLMFYPGSNREPIFEQFDNYPQTSLRTADPKLFREYQEYMDRLTHKYERRLFIAKKGEVLLWHGMLLHGGSEIKDPNLTRKSYVIHYMPPGMNVGNEIEGPFNW